MEYLETNKIISLLTLPFRVYGTSMRPGVLMMCKIFVVLLIAHGFFGSITDPFIPFISSLDNLNHYPNLLEYFIKALFILGSTSLIFNFKVRSSAILIACSIFLAILASKPIFRNHLFIIGCVFFLSGLTSKEDIPWLLFFQLGLVYFGALLNKMTQIEWWTGQFMHNWLSAALENPVYNSWYESTSNLILAKIMSYSAMLAELLIGFCLFLPKCRLYAITMILVFHTILFSFTGETFGYFMEDILIILIAFREWPKQRIQINYRVSKFNNGLINLIKLLDCDNRFTYSRRSEVIGNAFSANNDFKSVHGQNLIVHVLLSTSGFYIMVLCLEMGIRYLFNDTLKYIFLLGLFWILLLLLSPIFFNYLKQTRLKKVTAKS
jgi:hypothetical protein